MEFLAVLAAIVIFALGYVLGRKHTAQSVETQAVEEVGRGRYTPTIRHLMEESYIVGLGDGGELRGAGYEVVGNHAGKYSTQLNRFLLSHTIGMEWEGAGLVGRAVFCNAVTGLADDPFSSVGAGSLDTEQAQYQQ